ncbi:hypothetical protein NLX86_05080 [Streptomyces sp. A3M-1-3]|uniref:hypothetical protein n=1 Tax=Streptomyces sp. A3M-1-3 TaxID=2962044 RepID=UPI0020B8C46D|nr:hypothetical protein [Streptomyces sp. A3M-1-3]MCP3817531.1 hypothetical protein [Streptomyces sp. A3M-1-3]
MGGSRHTRRGRIRRPAAMVCALATLLAGLLLCLSAGEPHGGGTDDPGARRVSATMSAGHAEYTCPFDRSDCGTFSHLTPAVLTAPPPDAPAAVADVPHGGLLRVPADVRAAGAQPRAPDLHVLQVLRT